MEGFIAQVLQRRRNHETFQYYSVAHERRPDLAEKFGIATIPTLMVIHEAKVAGQLEGPRGCREIEKFLSPWLQ